MKHGQGQWFDSLRDQPGYKMCALVVLLTVALDEFLTLSVTESHPSLSGLTGSSKVQTNSSYSTFRFTTHTIIY